MSLRSRSPAMHQISLRGSLWETPITYSERDLDYPRDLSCNWIHLSYCVNNINPGVDRFEGWQGTLQALADPSLILFSFRRKLDSMQLVLNVLPLQGLPWAFQAVLGPMFVAVDMSFNRQSHQGASIISSSDELVNRVGCGGL